MVYNTFFIISRRKAYMAERTTVLQPLESLTLPQEHTLLTIMKENITVMLADAYPATYKNFIAVSDAGSKSTELLKQFVERATAYIPDTLSKAAKAVALKIKENIIATWYYISELHIRQILRIIEFRIQQISPVEP